MLRKLIAISVVLLTSFSISIAGSEPNMQEGKWEITTKTEMVGMSMSMPPMTRTQCLTKKDFVPQDSQQGQECKITDTKVVGNTVTWTIKCHGHGGDATGTGRIIYSGSSFEGTFEMTTSQSNMKMISHMSGHRLGDCK
jgi:hypothetical protein